MNALGRHLLMELEDCNEETLNNLEALKAAMLTAADEAGATVMGESFHRFSPHGISGVVVIAESHLCIHTWPEYGYAAADIFTCGTTVQPEKAAEVLVEKLGARKHSLQEIPRGLRVTERARLG
ncbi:MAG TPA: S-adenosylmethionine decarboxylase proenzyme [Dehalococcoidia bacterium]|nr:S-adenosylmethionine decarboxylase proenzyme [Dehalococcoidia bacterium]